MLAVATYFQKKNSNKQSISKEINLKATAPKHVPRPEHLNALKVGKLSDVKSITIDRLAQLQRPEILVCADVLLTAARKRGELHQLLQKSGLILKPNLSYLYDCYSVISHTFYCCDCGYGWCHYKRVEV